MKSQKLWIIIAIAITGAAGYALAEAFGSRTHGIEAPDKQSSPGQFVSAIHITGSLSLPNEPIFEIDFIQTTPKLIIVIGACLTDDAISAGMSHQILTLDTLEAQQNKTLRQIVGSWQMKATPKGELKWSQVKSKADLDIVVEPFVPPTPGKSIGSFPAA